MSKEKAIELVNRFLYADTVDIPNNSGATDKAPLLTEQEAVKYALICVDEMLEENAFFSYKISPLIVARRKYWQEVKQHLEK